MHLMRRVENSALQLHYWMETTVDGLSTQRTAGMVVNSWY